MHALLPLAPPQLSQPIGVSADALDAAFLLTGDVPRASISLAALGAPPGCFGACNDAGECKEGVCKCAATGSESYDCAKHATSWRPSPPVVAGAAAASQPQPFIYVYDLPPDLGLRKMRRFHDGSDPIYWSEKAFFDKLLADRRVRTLDPEAATLFVVPTWQYYQYSNVDEALRSFDELRPHLTHWGKRRPDGRDHVLFFTGDKGACGLPKGGPIYLAHWGLTVPFVFMGREGQAANATGPDAKRPPCTDERAVIVPPWGAASDKDIAAVSTARPATTTYPYELSFAGSLVAWNSTALPSELPAAADDRAAFPTYSQGVRQLVWSHHHDRPRFLISPTAQPASVFGGSRFCLAPSGDGFGVRLAKLMMVGCVPLIIQPKVRQPFDELLNYSSFALTLGRADIPHLHTILPAVDDATHAAMLAAVRRHAPDFSWARPESRAYSRTVELLRRRARELSA